MTSDLTEGSSGEKNYPSFEKLKAELAVFSLVLDALLLHSEEEIELGLSVQYERVLKALETLLVEAGVKTS